MAMTLCIYISEKYKTAYFHAGFFVCIIAFLLVIAYPGKSMAIDQQLLPSQEEATSNFRLPVDFFNEQARKTLFTAKGDIHLSHKQTLLFSSRVYSMRKYTFLPSFISSLEFHKRKSITDFGVIGVIDWPLFQQEKWSIHINGKVSGSQQFAGPAHQRNRWNFEHQIGWNSNYHITNDLQTSIGIYQYRIINDFQYDNPAQSYINSTGGFASLRYQF